MSIFASSSLDGDWLEGPAPCYDEQGRLIRVPLQDLPLTPSGGLAHGRRPTLRPVPTGDQENIAQWYEAVFSNVRLWQLEPYVYQALLQEQQAREAHRAGLVGDDLDDDDESEYDPAALRFDSPIDNGPNEDLPVVRDMGDEAPEDDYEPEDTSVEDVEPNHEEEHEGHEHAPPFDPTAAGLKEISNLGKFTVSSHKQGNGVEELRSDDLKLYWQSDGPQPHKLTVYFVKRVGIRDIRFYVDYNEDESYTPTKIVFKSGTSENNLIEFAVMELSTPVGWQQVPIAGAGGGPDGNTLVSYVFQMQILENHQNGKDTHLRGIKIYAFDNEANTAGPENNPVEEMVDLVDDAVEGRGESTPEESEESVGQARRMDQWPVGEMGLNIPDFMREPELR